MEKLIGNKNIAVFISGRGTNLKALIRTYFPRIVLYLKIKYL